MTKEELQVLKSMFEESEQRTQTMIKTELEPIKKDIENIKEDIAVLKEDVAVLKEDVEVLKEEGTITRENTNLLLKWAERADRTVVNAGLYDENKKNYFPFFKRYMSNGSVYARFCRRNIWNL